ncbi:MAG TPA: hypothetical protein ENF94_00020 [Candidatus Woesearchaeota archaeon]|nr:MAG: hypothetical protein DRJ25_00060 [Candidatus Woesearchaeota archaeon]HDD70525.1 hypothetical protein [Candidatus Woesearchaeota archaeon]
MKKGQGLPVSTIILILLGLIILVILIAMVVQKTKSAGKGLKEVEESTCAKAGGVPMPFGTECDIIYGSFKDTGVNKICCKEGSVK